MANRSKTNPDRIDWDEVSAGTIASGRNLGLDSNDNLVIASGSAGSGISHDGSTADGVLTYKDSDEATVESNLTFDGSTLTVAGDIVVNEFITHNGDADTKIRFTDDKIVLKAGNIAMVTVEKKGSAPHEVTINDGSNNIDFVVKGNGSGEGNPGMKFDASTNKLGINGVGTPDEALHVDGNIKVVGDDPRIKIDGDVDSHPGLELYENGTRKWIIYNNYANDNLTFKTNSNIRMTIAQSGLVSFTEGFEVGSDAAGDILYHNGTSYVRLAKGTADQVLTMNDAANAPNWETPSSGGSDTFVTENFGMFKFTNNNLFGHPAYTYNSKYYKLDQNLYGNSYANYSDPDDATFTATIVNSLLYIKAGIVPVACTLDTFMVSGYLVEAMSNGNAKFSLWRCPVPGDATAYTDSVTWTRVASVTWSGTGANDTWYKGTDSPSSGNSFSAGDWYAMTVQPSGTDTALSSGNSTFHSSMVWSPT